MGVIYPLVSYETSDNGPDGPKHVADNCMNVR